MSSLRDELIVPVHNSHRRRYWSQIDKDGYTCPMCSDSTKEAFDVHHINGDWMDGRMVNLVALCHDCHRRVHSMKRTNHAIDGWKDEFRSIVELGDDQPESVDTLL